MKYFFTLFLFAAFVNAQSPSYSGTIQQTLFSTSSDSVTFEEFASNTVITDQYISHGMIFSGLEAGQEPRVYDYGAASYGRILRSYNWYDAIKITFTVPGDSSLTPQPVNSLAFDNPVSSEVDYIDIKAYNSNDAIVHHHVSASKERVAMSFNEPVAYVVLDDSAGTAYVIDNIETNGVTVSVENSRPVVVQSLKLFENYPNPFNPQTTIRYRIAESANVTLRVFDMGGREVRSIMQGPVPAGEHEIKFNAGNLPSGVYLYKLITSKGVSESRKMLLIK